ncbi:substrate-binding domain-containing protein [Sphingomonas oryzagri]
MIRLSGLLVAFALAPATMAAPPSGPTLSVYAAGSMTGALGTMLKRYTAETGEPVTLRTGPAGLMLDRIEAGDPADLFVSANMAHPQRLTAEGKATATMVFARNRLCVAALPSVGLTSANMLERLLDPRVRIGTSTPKADPGGDYAWALFDRADAVRPGAGAILKAKARQIVGGRIETPAPAPKLTAAQAMEKHQVDVTIGYCSSHETEADPSVVKVEVPPALAVPVDYGMTVMTTSRDAARREAALRLGIYLMSSEAQQAMVPYGFIPVADSGTNRRR